jgi:alpha-glucosidase
MRAGIAALCLLSVASGARAPEPVARAVQDRPAATIDSPSGTLAFAIHAANGRLSYAITRGGRPAIERSRLGIVVDGTNLGERARMGQVERYEIDETYAWRGMHSRAVNRANGARIAIEHPPSSTRYSIDVRVFDDAAAFRFIVPGTGTRVPDAAAAFRLPAGTTVWSHGLRDHYEAVYETRKVDDVPAGDWAAPPVTFLLPERAGYVAISESDLRGYAGMVLQADGQGGYYERLAHAAPVGYPFTLRFGEAEAARLAKPASIDGTITTPWRVVLVAPDLNSLVNSDAIHNLAAPPDPMLFPQGIRTPWVKPGRAVWRYLDGGENTVAGIKEFSRLAGELGFEYQVIEGQWARWTEAELQDVVEYSKSVGVGIIVWRHSRTLRTPGERRELFAKLRKAGVVGLKVDFLDHEAKEIIDVYQAILKDAAEHQLLINFHGANKPAGEARTWPNEMTREGIYGLEHKRMEAWAQFNATFPFVRMLAGHADYTPTVFGERRRETSWAHQIASAAILTSPLLVYGGHPASFLSNPAVDMIKSIPSVWDETRVLPSSAIGELALFARRSGDRWFMAAMNGPEPRAVKLDMDFLGPGAYRALVVRDKLEDAAAVEVETKDARRGQPFEIAMRAGGGFVVRFTK